MLEQDYELWKKTQVYALFYLLSSTCTSKTIVLKKCTLAVQASFHLTEERTLKEKNSQV